MNVKLFSDFPTCDSMQHVTLPPPPEVCRCTPSFLNIYNEPTSIMAIPHTVRRRQAQSTEQFRDNKRQRYDAHDYTITAVGCISCFAYREGGKKNLSGPPLSANLLHNGLKSSMPAVPSMAVRAPDLSFLRKYVPCQIHGIFSKVKIQAPSDANSSSPICSPAKRPSPPSQTTLRSGEQTLLATRRSQTLMLLPFLTPKSHLLSEAPHSGREISFTLMLSIVPKRAQDLLPSLAPSSPSQPKTRLIAGSFEWSGSRQRQLLPTSSSFQPQSASNRTRHCLLSLVMIRTTPIHVLQPQTSQHAALLPRHAGDLIHPPAPSFNPPLRQILMLRRRAMSRNLSPPCCFLSRGLHPTTSSPSHPEVGGLSLHLPSSLPSSPQRLQNE